MAFYWITQSYILLCALFVVTVYPEEVSVSNKNLLRNTMYRSDKTCILDQCYYRSDYYKYRFIEYTTIHYRFSKIVNKHVVFELPNREFALKKNTFSYICNLNIYYYKFIYKKILNFNQ